MTRNLYLNTVWDRQSEFAGGHATEVRDFRNIFSCRCHFNFIQKILMLQTEFILIIFVVKQDKIYEFKISRGPFLKVTIWYFVLRQQCNILMLLTCIYRSTLSDTRWIILLVHLSGTITINPSRYESPLHWITYCTILTNQLFRRAQLLLGKCRFMFYIEMP